MTKAEAQARRTRWERALQEIAQEVGANSVVYKTLGSVAWGRYEGEGRAHGDDKENVMFGLGFLQGVRYAAMNAAAAQNLRGEDALRRIHDRIAEYERKPTSPTAPPGAAPAHPDAGAEA